MANELQLKYRSPITAQASATVPTAGMSAGATTVLVNTPEGNCAGAQAYQCYLNVTTGPTTAATARLYCAGAYSITNPGIFDSGSLSVAVPASTTGEIPLGILYDPDKYMTLKLGAENYGFTASLVVVPILAEAQ
jgi:hypothetical protein